MVLLSLRQVKMHRISSEDVMTWRALLAVRPPCLPVLKLVRCAADIPGGLDMTDSATLDAAETPAMEPRLTSLAHGGGCGCKIAPGVLEGILRGTTALPVPPELLVGIETSDDAAVYRVNETTAIVATTDFFMPVVDDAEDFGRIAATNAISDVYAMGATPIFALAIVGMPVNVLSQATIGRILNGGARACRAAGIPIAGGHTIDSVEPIYGLVAIGLLDPAHLKRNADARPGDALVLGKPLGVGIFSAALKKGALDAEGYARMIETTTRLNSPGPELARLPGVHAMTDVTGFGLAGHALEMARGSGATVEIDWDAVPLLEGARALAEAGHITGASGRNWASYGANVSFAREMSPIDQALICDPQTSGGLLVACTPESAGNVRAAFRTAGFGQAGVIGRIVEGAACARFT
jgi:selenide, water dikinase